jgi:hypothetical protein
MFGTLSGPVGHGSRWLKVEHASTEFFAAYGFAFFIMGIMAAMAAMFSICFSRKH